MRVRKLDADYDMTFGQGQKNFWRNVPDAPAQVVFTRLYLFEGEWFLDMTDGTPWKTQVLGKYTEAYRDAAIQRRILGSPGVTGIAAGFYASQVDRDTRDFSVQATIDTIYGQTILPGPI